MPNSWTDRRSAARAEGASRRTRLRLRELCDEVLASHRAATTGGPLTAQDRHEAAALLGSITPTLRG